MNGAQSIAACRNENKRPLGSRAARTSTSRDGAGDRASGLPPLHTPQLVVRRDHGRPMHVKHWRRMTKREGPARIPEWVSADTGPVIHEPPSRTRRDGLIGWMPADPHAPTRRARQRHRSIYSVSARISARWSYGSSMPAGPYPGCGCDFSLHLLLLDHSDTLLP